MLILNNISKGDIKDLSFYVSSGEMVCIIEENQNKLELLFNLMNGTEKAEKGVINYLDKGRYSREILRNQVGYVFNENIMLNERTLFENLEYVMQIKEIDMFSYRSRIRRILEIVDLKYFTAKKAGQLLKHQVKRLNIAQAILNYPPVLILEDPTRDLDQVSSQGILKLLKRLNKFSMTIVLLSSDKKLITGKDVRVLRIDSNYNEKKKGYYV
ncbi:MAG: ATP-binding cassette domain-containing protein [Halanaerobiaceae bacterium]